MIVRRRRLRRGQIDRDPSAAGHDDPPSGRLYIFHFVNVVDDIEMEITHVIRGEDHLSNTRSTSS